MIPATVRRGISRDIEAGVNWNLALDVVVPINLLETSLTGRRLEKLYSSFKSLVFFARFDFTMFRIFREAEGGRDYLYADISTREIVVENIYPRLTIRLFPFILIY